MRLGVRILRFLFPDREAERMALRHALHENQAHAEELTRVLLNGGGETLVDLCDRCKDIPYRKD